MTQQKITLIQEFLEVYLCYWKTNAGVDIFALQELPEDKLQERIIDYQKLLQYRGIAQD